MKILYKPFGVIASLIGGRIATAIFKAIWARVDDEAPPKPTTAETTFPKVLAAAVIEAATFAAVGAVIDRFGARAFHHLTGIWPGNRKEED